MYMLSPSIEWYVEFVDTGFDRTALEKAEVLLSMNHGMAHLDNIWGVGGGNRPVKYLTNKVHFHICVKCIQLTDSLGVNI